MVLELFTKNRNPFIIFSIGFIYASLGFILARTYFYNNISTAMVFLTSLACFYMIYTMIKKEEKYDLNLKKESKILKKHFHLIILFMMLYLGFFSAFFMFGLILSQDTVSHIFEDQRDAISSINSQISGSAISDNTMINIFSHNLLVLFIFFFFSFLFGAGAISLLVHNASVGGFFVGNFVKVQLLTYSKFSSFILGMLRYFPHAIFEFSAFFMSAIAGGIISVALVKYHYKSKHFFNVIKDVGTVLGISILILFFASFVEVYITPNLVGLFSKILI